MIKTIEITVTSESGEIRTYKVKATRENFENGEHTSKLSKLEVSGYEKDLEPVFHPLTNEYTLNIFPNEMTLDINYETVC